MEIRDRILARATQLFLQKGVKSISMDEIAADLGISKKTIYLYFATKAALVYEISQEYFRQEKAMMDEIAKQAVNALDELSKVVNWSLRFIRNVHPSVVYDIQKYYPHAWALFDEYKTHFVLTKLSENLERGISEGYYRKEINVEMVARMRLSQIDACLNPQYFPSGKFDFMELQVQMLEVYMNGIVTEKGREFLANFPTSSELFKPNQPLTHQ
ncbi:MAG: TetR/AcrR family transcriptional regulator [Bacteroidia bacterium]|nr:TetR/AcrR family transcriptional regulator [Bacteroidia bacterium]